MSVQEGKPFVQDLSKLQDPFNPKQVMRNVRRGAPGDAALKKMRSYDEVELARRKNQYYEECFAYREPNRSARDRIHKDSLITAEVKTNVIISDEMTFLTDLSQHLSQRFQRPTDSICITLHHTACLLFAGTSDPAYIITITALPSQVQPTINKRNAALTQSFMTSALLVTPDRGIVRFHPIPEENLATAGVTILGAIENLSKLPSEETRTRGTSKHRPRSRSRKRKESDEHHLGEETKSETQNRGVYSRTENPPMPAIPREKMKSEADKLAEKAQKLGKKKSFRNFFGRG